MNCQELIALFERHGRRWHLVGCHDHGVIAGLDLEGRLFTILNGEVVSRVNPEAFRVERTDDYVNPGGDGLWPAPEGTTLGYQYPTGPWRVPPSLVNCRYYVTDQRAGRSAIRAQLDLVNNQGVGLPTVFERDITATTESRKLTVRVEERITYTGARTLTVAEASLVPWSLNQFDCGPGCEVVFPAVPAESIWDLYDPSEPQRSQSGQLWHTRTDGTQRYQIALDRQVPWIEFRDPKRGLTVRRSADLPPADARFIDIADSPPDQLPGPKGVRYSVYADTDGFMEIEAAGTTPAQLTPGTTLSIAITTTYHRS